MKVKKGDIVQYVMTVKITHEGRNKVSAINLDNKEKFEINGEELYNNCISCDFFDKEEKITKTKLKDVFDQIYPGSLFSARFTKKDGEYREIRARFGANTIFGHCVVEDLDIEEEYRTRQVNYNTIQWVISNGVKYIVK